MKHTVMLIPHTAGKLKHFSFSTGPLAYALAALALTVIIIMLISIYTIFTLKTAYIAELETAIEDLARHNTAMAQHLEQIETDKAALTTKLDEIIIFRDAIAAVD